MLSETKERVEHGKNHTQKKSTPVTPPSRTGKASMGMMASTQKTATSDLATSCPPRHRSLSNPSRTQAQRAFTLLHAQTIRGEPGAAEQAKPERERGKRRKEARAHGCSCRGVGLSRDKKHAQKSHAGGDHS